ncbi:thiamine pyrophosphate-dependent acetolactate synthase large subunit-like protein [Mycolicibacterium sp. BK556]|uniref:thiamine pyrophosphate-binding protein n=1 Tax=unclassified Mycolicibacterium TaxID=2636767 RepID=UPI001621734C|nr:MULTISPECIES: thiamine pyrophosphate-binding protein [unclassified Mycolicibacterium]MBB3607054.1 thiamine pyrophosphate-dependent acetolactate synthase large subunit-like protein [Mycolicibacterium sp. BK556]MBB3636836.1 thiamine pyrophosphate-dependent acetolactate synthase large subunit-like protein [Mycolicibacterium sp. BK607]
MKVHAAIARTLADAGVDTIFGLIGDANMYFVADYIRSHAGRYVGAAMENGAVSYAHGYARVSGKVGIATVTHGPGAANTINPVIEAVRSHTPLVLITGDTPRRRHHPQEVDLRALFSATGATFHRVLRAEHVVPELSRVLAHAINTRRPIVLDIPFDLHHEDIDYRPALAPPLSLHAVAPTEDSLDMALGVLVNANRPLILAGRGALEAGAREELIELADLLGAPLATTAAAKDLFHGHPYNLGIMGNNGLDWAMDVIAKADCVAAFGASLGFYTTMDGELLPERSVIQCDVDPANIGRFQIPTVAVIGDARTTAATMMDRLRELGGKQVGFRTSALGQGVLEQRPTDDFVDHSTDTTLDVRTAMVILDDIFPKDRVLVTDGGRFVSMPWRYVHVEESRNFVHTFAWGSIGLGMATAVGAAVARPDLPTVCVAGDGGLMMGLIEFSTAVRENLPLLVVVLNDGAYGEEYDKFVAHGFAAENCFNTWPEFADVATAMGGRGATVRTQDQFRRAVAEATAHPGPMLIDVKTDPHRNPKDR